MNNLLGSPLVIMLLVVAAFLAGGFVFSPDFRAKVIALAKRDKGRKPSQPQSATPSWAQQGGDAQAAPPPPPDNGHADVEQARKILKRHGYTVRKRRRV
jgi:hypothetical protein